MLLNQPHQFGGCQNYYLRHRCRINSTSRCFWDPCCHQNLLPTSARCIVLGRFLLIICGPSLWMYKWLTFGAFFPFLISDGECCSYREECCLCEFVPRHEAAEHSLTCCVRWRRLAWCHSGSCAEVWPYIQLEKVRTKRVLKEERERSKIRFDKREALTMDCWSSNQSHWRQYPKCGQNVNLGSHSL